MASWLDQGLKSFLGGLLGKPPVTHPDGTTNPVHAVVDQFNAAGNALGSTITGVAETEVGDIVTKYAGAEGGAIATLLLQAVIATAQAKLAAQPAIGATGATGA